MGSISRTLLALTSVCCLLFVGCEDKNKAEEEGMQEQAAAEQPAEEPATPEPAADPAAEGVAAAGELPGEEADPNAAPAEGDIVEVADEADKGIEQPGDEKK